MAFRGLAQHILNGTNRRKEVEEPRGSCRRTGRHGKGGCAVRAFIAAAPWQSKQHPSVCSQGQMVGLQRRAACLQGLEGLWMCSPYQCVMSVDADGVRVPVQGTVQSSFCEYYPILLLVARLLYPAPGCSVDPVPVRNLWAVLSSERCLYGGLSILVTTPCSSHLAILLGQTDSNAPRRGEGNKPCVILACCCQELALVNVRVVAACCLQSANELRVPWTRGAVCTTNRKMLILLHLDLCWAPLGTQARLLFLVE
eukprot:1148719-Pelagomonas_calceolata.AAC.4